MKTTTQATSPILVYVELVEGAVEEEDMEGALVAVVRALAARAAARVAVVRVAAMETVAAMKARVVDA